MLYGFSVPFPKTNGNLGGAVSVSLCGSDTEQDGVWCVRVKTEC